MSTPRLSLAMDIMRIPGREAEEPDSVRADRVAVWILLALGLLLMLVASGKAETPGNASLPRASITSSSGLDGNSPVLPTATMLPFSMISAPSRMIRRLGSTVTR